MSREIEIKVPLSEEQFSEIKKILTSGDNFKNLRFRSLSHVIKSDEYFSRYKTHEARIKNNELRVIRIRTEKNLPMKPSGIDMFGDESENGEKSYFCIKRKTIENGAEFNSEHETFVENAEVLRVFFEASGFIKWFDKKKDAFSVFCTFADGQFSRFEAHLELEKVNDYPYIEIEYTKDDLEEKNVLELLEKILAILGVDGKKRDSRSWAEILVNTSKNGRQ